LPTAAAQIAIAVQTQQLALPPSPMGILSCQVAAPPTNRGQVRHLVNKKGP